MAEHVPGDDPPGADSSPMSELQRAALAEPKPFSTEFGQLYDEYRRAFVRR